VIDAIEELDRSGEGPARAALDGHRREEDGEVPKPKKKSSPNKKSATKKKPGMSSSFGTGLN
jgi:hypothetical protein